MLGMYVHMHWSYNHPYAARTWSEADWRSYLQGLRSLGYDFLMVWPMLDSMPPEPNASDLAFLEKLGRIIRVAQDDFGMKVAIVSCPNTIGNEKSASHTFERRPYFACERKLNPANRAEVELLLAGRRRQFRPISHADAVVVIDSDPGGYIGSTNEEFVSLMAGQIGVFREMNARAELIYWMLFGWEAYNRFWAEAAQWKPGQPHPRVQSGAGSFRETLSLVQARIPEPWWVFSNSNMPSHLEATDALGLGAKRGHFPYGLIEGEPTFPLTNCEPRRIAEAMKRHSAQTYPRGFMANSQTHALQLPHTYLVAHHVVKGSDQEPDLVAFADEVIPGRGVKIAMAWGAIGGGDAEVLRACAHEVRAEAGRPRSNETSASSVEPLERGKPHKAGPHSGLLLGSADRFLTDLAMNLDVRAGMADLKAALDESRDARVVLRRLLADLRPYQDRLGFVDAYGGPLHTGLNQQVARLDDPKIAAVLEQFNDWRNPAIRHGILPRLLNVLDEYCTSGE